MLKISSRKRFNSFFDSVTLAAWIIIASGAGMILYLGPKTQVSQATAEGGGLGIQAVYATLYVLFVALLAVRFRTPLSILLEEKWILILCLWAFASTLWSPLHGMTLRRCIALLGTTLAGLFVAKRFEPKEQVRIVAHCVGFTAIASLVACLLLPNYAVAPTHEWTGIFYQKNALGHTMALGVLCYAFLALGQRRGRLVSIFMAIFCGGMLFMSKSATAMIVCTAMLIVLRFRKLLVQRARALIAFAAAVLVVGIPVGIYVIQNMEAILKGLGRDATLTGRVPLWSAVLDEISVRPLRGFGYSAFWFSSEGARVQTSLGWQMTHSHNGYLEVTLGLGLIGLAFLVTSLLKNASRGIRFARGAETLYDFWPLFYLVFGVADNFTESWFLTPNSLVWMLFVANSYWLVQKSLEPVTEEEDDTEPTPEFSLGIPMNVGPAES